MALISTQEAIVTVGHQPSAGMPEIRKLHLPYGGPNPGVRNRGLNNSNVYMTDLALYKIFYTAMNIRQKPLGSLAHKLKSG